MEACHRAVDHLDGAARDARRAVNGAVDLAPEDLAALTGTVLTQSAWGTANAALELAIAARRAAEYAHALGEIEGRAGV